MILKNTIGRFSLRALVAALEWRRYSYTVTTTPPALRNELAALQPTTGEQQ